MSIDFPSWSDLGMEESLSERTRFAWDYQLMLCERYRRYFDGDVFQDTIEVEKGNEDEDTLLFPIGLNLVKMLTMAQADAAFGEWSEQPIRWSVGQDMEVTPPDEKAISLLTNIMDISGAGAMFWEMELERNVYGGSAMKISPYLSDSLPHIRWTHIPREGFFPVWDPENQNELLEVYIIVWISAEQAQQKYRYEASGAPVRYIEHWVKDKHETFLNDRQLKDYSGVNPFGVVPFIYVPRMRFSTWWGDALTADIIPVQDELNMRVADMADAINYNAHPVRWGLNLGRDFNAKNFPIGPNTFWNLGRSIGQSPPPEVGILEAKAAVAQGVTDHIKFIYDWGRTSADSPPVAFGEDQGGGQRSGATLEIRMWPLLRAIRRSRSYHAAAMKQALYITGNILKQKLFPDIQVRTIDALLENRIVPSYADIMPRDQSANVDEVVRLMSTKPAPSISLETAQTVLGRGAGEVRRIKAMLQDDEVFYREDLEAQQKLDAAKQAAQAKAAKPDTQATN
jgi:hypothetical protein